MRPSAPNPERLRQLDDQIRQQRRNRSLQTCHRPAFKPPARQHTDRTNAYVPEVSARLLNDPGLSDGARRCAMKVMELAYRRNRKGRALACTVSYLARALRRSERTIQNYLAQLRARGYILHEVVTSVRARMSVGIFLTLLKPIFPKHREREWPVVAGVKTDSQNYSFRIQQGRREPVEAWAMRCMNGVFRAFMKSPEAICPQ